MIKWYIRSIFKVYHTRKLNQLAYEIMQTRIKYYTCIMYISDIESNIITYKNRGIALYSTRVLTLHVSGLSMSNIHRYFYFAFQPPTKVRELQITSRGRGMCLLEVCISNSTLKIKFESFTQELSEGSFYKEYSCDN